MEKKEQQLNENHKSKSIHDILPLELIHIILLRVPLKQLGRLKCVSKLWNTLISDPHFAESHLHLPAAPTHVCLFISNYSKTCSVDIDAAFHDYNCATAAKEDDYLVVVASQDKNGHDHFDCLSLRTNSWTNLGFAVSKPLGRSNWESRGFFLNGAIHWSSCTLSVRDYSILIFDLKERSFSTISMPEQVMGYLDPIHLVLLGGCLALYSYECDKTNIWVMKQYKVQSSWTFYQISRKTVPLYLSNGSDIVALDFVLGTRIRFAKYNAKGELLQRKHVDYPHWLSKYGRSYTVYTECLAPLPTEIKDKDMDKKKKSGHQNQKGDVKQGKRTRSK
ncbi:hypothetical protein HN873_049913 [Arachis hypogaea]|uniref:F-box domain-containing protein n=1 Tax=Arachis hypogaea TaxID=3818 RepID=A0A444WNH0_ARAHY|nr:hypothetical protein Ahy_Scaffold8g108353 [Arachis hypogaea]